MTEIKTWGDRLAEIPDGTITTSYHVTGAMQDEIDELRARLAQQAEMVEKCMVAMNENADRGMKAEQERDELFRAALEQVEPVAWQCRTRPDWHDQWMGWVDCSKEVFEDYTRVPLLHDWHYEVRELFTHPVRPMSDEEIEDAFSRLPNAKSGQFYYYLGIADAEAFHGIKGATE